METYLIISSLILIPIVCILAHRWNKKWNRIIDEEHDRITENRILLNQIQFELGMKTYPAKKKLD